MSVSVSIASTESERKSFNVSGETKPKTKKSVVVLLMFEFCFSVSLANDLDTIVGLTKFTGNTGFLLFLTGVLALFVSFFISWISDSYVGKFRTLILIGITSVVASGVMEISWNLHYEILYNISIIIHYTLGEAYTTTRFAFFLDQIEESLHRNYLHNSDILYNYLYITFAGKSFYFILDDVTKTFDVDLVHTHHLLRFLSDIIPLITIIAMRKIFKLHKLWFRVVDHVFIKELHICMITSRCSKHFNNDNENKVIRKYALQTVFVQLLCLCTVPACLCTLFTKKILVWHISNIDPENKFWIMKLVFNNLYYFSLIVNVAFVRYVIVTFAYKIKKAIPLHFKIFCFITMSAIILNICCGIIVIAIESEMFIPRRHIIFYNMNRELIFYKQINMMTTITESKGEEWQELAASSYLNVVVHTNTEMKFMIMSWNLAKNIRLLLSQQVSYVISSTIKEINEESITKVDASPIIKVICALDSCNGIITINGYNMNKTLKLMSTNTIALTAGVCNISIFDRDRGIKTHLLEETLAVYALYSLIVYDNQDGDLKLSLFLLNRANVVNPAWILPCLYLESLIQVMYRFMVVKYIFEEAPKQMRTTFSFFALSGHLMTYLFLLATQNFVVNEMYSYGYAWCGCLAIIGWIVYFGVPRSLKLERLSSKH